MPLCHQGSKIPKQSETEQAFFRSANELCSLHSIQPIDVQSMAYPYNILLLHRDIKYKLNRKPYETELFIVKNTGERKVALATKQSLETGNTLYYIPVIPLFRFLKKKANRRCGELLLAVMSYLYREAAIPYFRDNYSFMFDEYEYNREYLQEIGENTEEKDYGSGFAELRKNEICGDIMHRKIYSPRHLQRLAGMMKRFDPKNDFEAECLNVAGEVWQLYLDFPGNTVFQHIPDNDDENETASPDTYISFIGDGKGWIYDNIERSVNDLLCNFSQMAVPESGQVFDGTATKPQTIEFEYRLFELIINLCNILYELP